ncbi:glycosyltransferase family 29 protein [Falsiroseomonas sp.]|uniref:glycosyltransferase family 29 protein n=1 Tax=Falsiroseomonas sp. TaxID=2870721 RepID=UPI0034A28E47
MRAYALIPARSGSKGLPDKNVLPIAGHPLLAYSVAFGKRIPVERVLVSTDSPRYAEIGRAYGAEIPGLRGPTASGDTAMEEDILAELDTVLPARGIPLPDIWVWLKPTSPFRDPGAVAEAIAVLRARPEVDAVRIVSEADARLHRINDEGWLEPLLDSWDPMRSKMRRSEFPRVFQPFNLEVFRHAGWKARGSLFMGRRIHPIVLPRLTGLDVDDRDGFELIRILVEATPRPDLVARHIPLPAELPEDPRAGLSYGELEQAYHAADAAGRAALLAAVMRRETGQYSQAALDLARFDPAPLDAACAAILRDFPVHRVALRALAWCRGRVGAADGARAALARLLEAWPDQGLDSRRELLRLHLLGTHDAPAREGDWQRHGRDRGELSRLSYLVQRAVAEGAAPDLTGFEAALAARRHEALAEPGPAAAALALLRSARSIALVGNGPGLAGSGAARAIESHDLVMRLNYPVILGHEADVGSRTDLMFFDSSHRVRVAERMARHPSFPITPALCTHEAPQGAPGLPIALMRLVCDLTYTRPTSGFAALVLAGVVLGKPVTLFGFDFFRPGGRGHYYDAAAAPFTHETGYERWFVERVLPMLRPQVRQH